MTESLFVFGSSSSAVIARVRAALEPLADYILTAPSDDVVQVARRAGRHYRPREFCTIRTIQEPQWLVVTVSGQLGPSAMDAVRAAVNGRDLESGGGLAADSFRPTKEPTGSTPFVPPADWFVAADSQVEAHNGPAALLTTNDACPLPAAAPAVAVDSVGGKDTLVLRVEGPSGVERKAVVRVGNCSDRKLSGVLLVGRAPERRPADPADTTMFAVSDVAMSKTHLALGSEGHDVWIEDRNSSNGTAWRDTSGIERPVVPGTRMVVELPCQVIAGDSVISIGWGA